MEKLEQLKHEGVLDMISQLGTLTDDEVDTLKYMFYERWGNASYGMCLNPLFLLLLLVFVV